jgi:hypothetical protein
MPGVDEIDEWGFEVPGVSVGGASGKHDVPHDRVDALVASIPKREKDQQEVGDRSQAADDERGIRVAREPCGM